MGGRTDRATSPMEAASITLRTTCDIAIVDADPVRSERLRDVIARGVACNTHVVSAAAELADPDLVILVVDNVCPTERIALLACCGSAPVLVVTPEADERAAIEWILAGADDVATITDETGMNVAGVARRVMARSRRHELAAAVLADGATPTVRMETAPPATSPRRKKSRVSSLVAFLQAAALTDPLTGLANRRAMDARLERLWAESLRDGQDLAVLMVDLDDFKKINDEFGHARGDALLMVLGDVMRAQCRKADVAARYGGDEVVVLLPKADTAQAHAVAERLREDFLVRAAHRHKPDETVGKIANLSVGVASRLGTTAASREELLARADEALYAAKRSGKGCTRVSGAACGEAWRAVI